MRFSKTDVYLSYPNVEYWVSTSYYAKIEENPILSWRGGGRDALLLKQIPYKQTGFVLLLKQNKSDLVFYDEN